MQFYFVNVLNFIEMMLDLFFDLFVYFNIIG